MLKVRGLNKVQSAAVLFILGLVVGLILANLFRKYYIDDMKILDYTYYSIMNEHTLDYTGLLKYTLLNNFREFIIYWVLCFTVLGIPCVIFTIVYKGFEIGFLISAVTISYGGKGILLFLSYVMPQGIIYLFVILISLNKGHQLAEHSYYRSKSHVERKRNMLAEYSIIIVLLCSLLVIGSIVETYFGSSLLRKTLKLCL